MPRVRVLPEVAWIRIWLTEFRLAGPKRSAEAVVSGRIAWSSGLATCDDVDDEPTVFSTPITDIG